MIAIDTNILIYRLDRAEPVKQAIARDLLRQLKRDAATNQVVILWQVLGELMRHLRHWQDRGEITRELLIRYVRTVLELLPLVVPTANVVDHALNLSGRYSLSHWDAMLLGACQDAGVTVRYTEDMGAPRIIDGVTLINPFT